MYVAFVIFNLLCYASNGHQVYNYKENVIVDSSDEDSVHMLVMGDWGGLPNPPYYSPFEKVTANAMMKYAKNHEDNTDFVLALGDNFYYNGVVDEYDARFTETFEKVFADSSFQSIPWFLVAGNHDHYGNITGQLEYTKHSSRWKFPKLWYGVRVMRPKFNMTIVMIDTVTLCGNTLYDEEGNQPDGNIDEMAASTQLQFIEDLLKNNRDHYVLVGGHFPVWSVAEHGPTQCLIDKLKPLLEKYGVSAYLCGHDHNLQHIRESNSSVEYFLSGAVDVVDPNTSHENAIPPDSLRFHWANILGLGGFASAHAHSDHLTMEFHSAVGDKLYKYHIHPRK